MATASPTWKDILKRLYWDLKDPMERMNYGYWFIWQLPGSFGSMVRVRYLSPRFKRVGRNLFVFPGCRFRSIECMEIGNDVYLGVDNFFQARGGLKIGDNVMLAPGVKVWSVNHEYGHASLPVADQGHEAKAVSIGNNVFIGANAFILPGAILNEGTIVCAGAIVGGKEYPPFAILAGNPARVIGFRGRDLEVSADASMRKSAEH